MSGVFEIKRENSLGIALNSMKQVMVIQKNRV